MNKIATAAIVSLALLGSATVHAAGVDEGKSRSQVVAELQAAKDAGQISRGNLDYPPAFVQTSELSRSQVVAERDAAEAAGQISHGNLDYPPVMTAGAEASRSQVIAERDAAEAAGLISRGNLDYPPQSQS